MDILEHKTDYDKQIKVFKIDNPEFPPDEDLY